MKNFFALLSICLPLASFAASGDHSPTSAPSVIIAHPDGRYEMRLDQENELRHGDAVTIQWKAADGVLHPRKIYAGMSSDGLGSHHALVPRYLVREADGSWSLLECRWKVHHGPKGYWRTEIPGSDYVHVRDLNTPTALRANPTPDAVTRGSSLIYTYDNTNKPSYLSDAEVARAIDNAVRAVKTLLVNDSVPGIIQFIWTDFSNTPNMFATAVSNTDSEFRNLNTIRVLLDILYTPNDTDGYETPLQEYFPSSNLSYRNDASISNTTNNVWLSFFQMSKLLLMQQPTQVIQINAAITNFDADASDGIGAGQYDLTAILIHEIFHLLGFDSTTDDTPLFANDPITMWDVFRFNASNSFISGPTFSSGTRELRSAESANAVLQLNSTFHLWPLSRGERPGGDGRQASHWLDDDFGDYIGIMDPTSRPGMNAAHLTPSGTYFTIADIRALDVLGYDINISDYTPFPTITEPVLFFPIADAEVNPAVDIVFSWNAGNPFETDLLVYDLGTTIGSASTEPILVYRQDGIVGGSVSVPPAQIGLQPGHQYRWNIGAYHNLGFAASPSETFFARCLADWNNDGLINFFDLAAYMGAFNAMDPTADLAAPFGVWNFFDIAAFQALQTTGCP